MKTEELDYPEPIVEASDIRHAWDVSGPYIPEDTLSLCGKARNPYTRQGSIIPPENLCPECKPLAMARWPQLFKPTP